jgi:hypothetical protein
LFYLYKITVGGKSYIGTAKVPRLRLRVHARAKTLLGAAIRRCGLSTVKMRILTRSTSIRKLHRLESKAIARHHTRVPIGYNISYHGNGWSGAPHSAAWRKAQKKGARKRSASPKWRSAQKAGAQKRIHDPHWRALTLARLRDPDWLASRSHNKKWRKANRRRAKLLSADPGWRSAIARAARKRSRDPKWIRANARSHKRLARDPRWRAAVKRAGRKRSRDPKWRAALAAGIKRRSENYWREKRRRQ